jgi:hypothetical protein
MDDSVNLTLIIDDKKYESDKNKLTVKYVKIFVFFRPNGDSRSFVHNNFIKN